VLLCWVLLLLVTTAFAIQVWQFNAARAFPLHQRGPGAKAHPPVSILKPLKGEDVHTHACLRSWLTQDYPGEVEVLFGLADSTDPACPLVLELLKEFPHARLVLCPEEGHPNAKVGQLLRLEATAHHELLVICDADVLAPPDLLRNLVATLEHPGVGLATCLYRAANPVNLPMRVEAVALNADFWSQVLQARTLAPQDFALGATMALPRQRLRDIGGFAALADFLADDFLLGRRIVNQGHRIELCPVVVDCWDPPLDAGQVWEHQLRWARTIRVCLPGRFALSIFNNVTLWWCLWTASGCPAEHSFLRWPVDLLLVGRIAIAWWLQRRMAPNLPAWQSLWLVPLKDLLNVALWFGAFTGNTVNWRGTLYRVASDGRLRRMD
jgi:ceramide glucosyltransferase